MRVRYCEFRQKEVINISDGCRLGYVCDLELELPEGEIKAIIVPGPCKYLGLFGRDEEFIIPWCCIKRVGSDTVLVELERDKMRHPKHKKLGFG